MRLPDYPVKGKAMTAQWGRTLVEFLRSLVPSGGPGIRVQTTANGTTISATPDGGAGVEPFNGQVILNGDWMGDDFNDDPEMPWLKIDWSNNWVTEVPKMGATPWGPTLEYTPKSQWHGPCIRSRLG